MVNTVSYEMKVPKELKDVVDLLAQAVDLLVKKKPMAEFTLLLPALLLAVDGVGAIAEEVKSEYRDEAAAYLVHKILGQLLPVAVEKE